MLGNSQIFITFAPSAGGIATMHVMHATSATSKKQMMNRH